MITRGVLVLTEQSCQQGGWGHQHATGWDRFWILVFGPALLATVLSGFFLPGLLTRLSRR